MSIDTQYETVRVFGMNQQTEDTFFEEFQPIQGCWFGKLSSEFGKIYGKLESDRFDCYCFDQQKDQSKHRHIVYVLNVHDDDVWNDIDISEKTRKIARLNMKKHVMTPPSLVERHPKNLELDQIASETLGFYQVEGPSVNVGHNLISYIDKSNKSAVIMNVEKNEVFAQYDNPHKGALVTAELATLFQQSQFG